MYDMGHAVQDTWYTTPVLLRSGIRSFGLTSRFWWVVFGETGRRLKQRVREHDHVVRQGDTHEPALKAGSQYDATLMQRDAGLEIDPIPV